MDEAVPFYGPRICPVAQASKEWRRMSKSILVADDDARTRTAVRRILEDAGFGVAEAEDGVDALDKAAELSPDLVILDLRMPRLNGVEAASLLKKRSAALPVVLLTAYDVGRALVSASGIDAVISKDDGARKLTDCVQKLLRSGPKNSPPHH